MRVLLTTITLASFAYANMTTIQEHYDKGDFNQTIIEAKKSKSEYANPKLHLLWAKSAEALGDLKGAMSAYERVLILDENSTEAKLALVKIYEETSRESMAQAMYKELESSGVNKEKLATLAPVSKFDFGVLKARALAGIGYDSNINVSASANDLDKFYGTTGHSAEKSTLFAKVNASANYFNDLGHKGGYYIKAGVKLSYQNNSDASYFNMLVTGFEMGVGHKNSRYRLYIPIAYDKIHYLQTDLLTQFSIAPKVTIPYTQNLLLNVNTKYASRNYNDAKYKAMADHSYGVGGGINYLIGKNYLYAKMNYEMFSSSKSKHFSYLDKNMFTTTLGGKYSINNLYTTSLSYTYRSASYDDKTTTGDAREDNYNKVNVKVLYAYFKNVNFFVSESYTKNSSNHVPAKYSKNILMFGMNASY